MTIGIDGNMWYCSNGLCLGDGASKFTFERTLRLAVDTYRDKFGKSEAIPDELIEFLDKTPEEYNARSLAGSDVDSTSNAELAAMPVVTTQEIVRFRKEALRQVELYKADGLKATKEADKYEVERDKLLAALIDLRNCISETRGINANNAVQHADDLIASIQSGEK